MNAYVDESYCEQARIYIVAAVLVPSGPGKVRAALRSTFPDDRDPFKSSFHWNSEGPLMRTALLNSILALPNVQFRAFIRTGVSPKSQEGVRSQLLTDFLVEFCAVGGDRLILDRRRDPFNEFDQRTIIRAQKEGEAAPALTYTFKQPSREHILWAADAIAGAVHADREKGDGQFLQLLGDRLTIGGE